MIKNESFSSDKLNFLTGGGEMEEFVRDFDWTKTPLGKLESWSISLKYAVHYCLISCFPTLVLGSHEFITVYNDAYIPICGKKHPRILGLPGKVAFSEIWPRVGEKVQEVMGRGVANKEEDFRLLLDKNGFLEENYQTLSISPIGLPEEKTEGILVTIIDTTPRVIHARHTQTIKALGERSMNAKTTLEACRLMMEGLHDNNADIPFALLYLLDVAGQQAILQGTVRVEKNTEISPSTILLDDAKSVWPLARVIQNRALEIVDVSHFPQLPKGCWEIAPTQAILVPIIQAGAASSLMGFFIAGANPRRMLDEASRNFHTLITSFIASSLVSAQICEKERQQIESLAEMDRAKTEFFSNVSHEFRTPLMLLLGPLEDALIDLEHPLPPPQKARLELMQRSACRLLMLTNTLLDFARLEAGRAQAHYAPTDLAKFTKELSGMFLTAIEKAGLQLKLEIEPLKEPVYIDHDMWEKILFNLLSNALRNTLKGNITVSLKEDKHHVELTVSDTGIGISENDLPQIFERFYRAERTLSRSYEGTGIGLPLTQELVKLHGGTIHVASEAGIGSAFTVRIPLGKDHLSPDHVTSDQSSIPAPQSGAGFMEEAMRCLSVEKKAGKSTSCELKPTAQPITQAALFKIIPNAGKAKIIVADDNVDMREYISDLLAPCYEIIAVADGEAALEAIKKYQPNLVLSDIMMPKLNGLEFVRILRQEPAISWIPVILLTARAGEEAHIEGLEQGADACLMKPFSTKELQAYVKAHLKLGCIRAELKKSVEKLQHVNAALAKSEQNYRVLASVSPVGIYHLKDGQVSYINPKGCEIIGLTNEEISQGKWVSTLHPEDKNAVLKLLDKAKKGEIDHFKLDYRYLHRDGAVVWVTSQAIIEKDASGERRGYIGTLTNITQLKNSEKIRCEEAEKFRRNQEQFIDTLCHELRNPLAGVYGNVNLLLSLLVEIKEIIEANVFSKEQLSEAISKIQQSLEEMDQCAKYQKVILDDVLNLSKLEAHKVGLVLEDFNPNKIVKETAEMLQVEIRRKHLNANIQWIDPEIYVNGDPLRLKQVLLNLLSNAIKFTPEKGMITISLSQIEQQEEGRVVLQFIVEDTGVGMTAEEKALLFGRFTQASRRTFQKYGGSGLGLAISKKLVELMGGEIRVESEEQKGTKFTFTTNCGRVNRIEKKSKESKPTMWKPATSQTGLSVLIAEDNLINQKILKKQLEQGGYQCHVVNNGKEAVDFFVKTPVDILIMDVEMPGMNGLEATRAIREIEKNSTWPRPAVPVIGLSGNASQESIAQALSSGMNDYMVKPCSRDQLLEKITEYIQRTASSIQSMAC